METEKLYPKFTQALRDNTPALDPDPAFVRDLQTHLLDLYPQTVKQKRQPLFRPAWQFAAALSLLLLAAVLLIGPQNVYAQLSQLFGYIPGVGLVERDQPVRILKERVSLTRDGIILQVTGGILTNEKTQLGYHLFGIPQAALQPDDQAPGCDQKPVLILPDGSQIPEADGFFGPLPANVDQAVLSLACLPGTSDPTLPRDWALHLQFVPAPEDFPVRPVEMLEPQAPDPLIPLPAHPVASNEVLVRFTRVIPTDSGYILTSQISPANPDGRQVHVVAPPIIKDSSGDIIAYSADEALAPEQYQSQPDGSLNISLEIPESGTAFPVTLSFQVKLVPPGTISHTDLAAYLVSGDWEPDPSMQPVTPATNPRQLCFTNADLQAVPQLPAASFSALYTRTETGSVLHISTDGQTQTLAQSQLAAGSPDGSHLAWVNAEGLTVYTTADGTSQLYPTLQPEALSWSPSGRYLAAAINPNMAERAILEPATGEITITSGLSKERFAGWSADETRLYLLIPGSSGDGWMLMSYEIESSAYSEVFYLENSSPKNPMAVVSPNGRVIAYHGSTQASVYLKPMDDSQAALLVDAPGQMTDPASVTSITWSADLSAVAIGLILPGSGSQPAALLITPDGCALSRLPAAGQILSILR